MARIGKEENSWDISHIQCGSFKIHCFGRVSLIISCCTWIKQACHRCEDPTLYGLFRSGHPFKMAAIGQQSGRSVMMSLSSSEIFCRLQYTTLPVPGSGRRL